MGYDITGLLEQSPYIGLFLLLILGALGFPFPEDMTLILCGFLISIEAARPVPAFLVIYAGLLITDFGLYYVGRKYGRKIVTHRKFRKIITSERLSQLENKFEKWGILFILIGRHLFGLRAQLFLASGVMKMSAAKFLLADAFSSLFTIAIMVGAGYAGGYSLEVIRKQGTRVEYLAGIILAVLAAVIYAIYRYVRARRKATV
jgi:membrane protein DedA with SNARE-associated domain